MAEGIKLILDAAISQFQAGLDQAADTMARAATAAVRDVGIGARNAVRANMRSAGLPAFWGTGNRGVQVRFTPSKGQAPSIDASANVHGGPGFLGVFEVGAQIGGKPLLWLPLKDIPQKIGGRAMRPALFRANFGPLVSAKNSPIPLLLGQIAVGAAGYTPATKKTVYRFRRAKTAAHKAWVPCFIGITAVQLHKRLQFLEILDAAQQALPERYAEYIAQFSR